MVRQIFMTAVRQWKYKLRNMDFWVVLITIGAFFTSFFLLAGKMVRQAGDHVGIFSMFSIGMGDWFFFVIITVGFMFAISDIPVYPPDNDWKVLRMSRRTWYVTQWVYLAFMVLTYIFFIWLMELAFYLPNWALTTGWGDAVENGSALRTEFGILEVPTGLTGQSALAIFGMGVFLFLLLGMVIGGVCLVCNMYFSNAGVSIFVCSLVIYFYMLERHGDLSLGMLSPLGVYTGFWSLGPLAFLVETGYYAALCILLFMAGLEKLHKIDLKSEARKA